MEVAIAKTLDYASNTGYRDCATALLIDRNGARVKSGSGRLAVRIGCSRDRYAAVDVQR